MSAKHLVEKLKALSLAHEAITGTQVAVKQHEDSVKQKEANIKSLEEQIIKLDKDFKCAQKSIDTFELELSTIQEEEAKLQKTLKTLKKQKECVAIEKELALLARRRYDTERSLEDACNSIAGLKQATQAEKTRIQKEQSSLKNDLLCCSHDEKNLKEKLSAVEHQWNDALHEVPTEWQSKYARMLNSVTNPIVQVNNSVCGACFYTVVEKDLQRVKLGEIITCRSCYRLLYSADHVPQIDTPARQASY